MIANGNIAQSAQRINTLKHAVVGGIVGDGGEESIRHLSYNGVFTYDARAVQDLSPVVKAQQLQNAELYNTYGGECGTQHVRSCAAVGCCLSW